MGHVSTVGCRNRRCTAIRLVLAFFLLGDLGLIHLLGLFFLLREDVLLNASRALTYPWSPDLSFATDRSRARALACLIQSETSGQSSRCAFCRADAIGLSTRARSWGLDRTWTSALNEECFFLRRSRRFCVYLPSQP